MSTVLRKGLLNLAFRGFITAPKRTAVTTGFSALNSNRNLTIRSFTSTSIKQQQQQQQQKEESTDEVAPIVDFAKMKSITLAHDPNVVLVDVREPDEFSAGHIPGAINVPVKSAPGALGLHEEEFKLRFGFDKPDVEKTLVFYCLAGVRSTMAEELAYTFGYNKRLNYVGSFNNWVQQNGAIETPKTED